MSDVPQPSGRYEMDSMNQGGKDFEIIRIGNSGEHDVRDLVRPDARRLDAKSGERGCQVVSVVSRHPASNKKGDRLPNKAANVIRC